MKKVKFSDVVTRANTKEDKDNTKKVYYVGGEHIDTDEVLITKRGIIKGSNIGPMFYFGFKTGQVLFVSRNPHLRKAGKVIFDGICSEKTFVLETKNNSVLLQDYLPFVLRTEHFWNYVETHKSGSVNFFVNWSTLAKYEFILPDIEIQRKISNILWAINNTKEKYKELFKQIDELLEAQYTELFDSDEFKKKELKDISTEWIKGQALKKDDMVVDGENSCIHYGELFTKYGPFIDEAISKTNVDANKTSQYGDILFPASDVTPNGLTKCSAILEDGVILGGDIIAMRPLPNLNPAWLSFAIRMQKKQLLSRVTGSVVRHISAKSLQTVSVPVPPRGLQDEFELLLRHSDKLKNELQQAIESCDAMMKKILNESLKEMEV